MFTLLSGPVVLCLLSNFTAFLEGIKLAQTGVDIDRYKFVICDVSLCGAVKIQPRTQALPLFRTGYEAK